jgi:hypothetical protein
MPGMWKALFLALCAASAALITYLPKKGLHWWLLCLWLGIFTPLFVVSLGDLVARCGLEPALWEGANYLLPPAPAFLAFALLGAKRNMDAYS